VWEYFAAHPVRPRVNIVTMSMIFINDNDFIASNFTRCQEKHKVFWFEQQTGKKSSRRKILKKGRNLSTLRLANPALETSSV